MHIAAKKENSLLCSAGKTGQEYVRNVIGPERGQLRGNV
jgi:hypothetical protein